MSLYELTGVAKVFQRGPAIVRALDAVDLRIEAGEFVALEGPSGSGKTTLLQILGALDRPSAGTVTFDGRDLVQQPDSALAVLRLRSFGFVFQQFNLIPTLTAVENVEAKLAPVGGSRERALESRSRGHCRSSRVSCSRTSRRATSTRRPAARSSTCSRTSPPSTARR
jgi:putative ABC transport system ATP-binding protein